MGGRAGYRGACWAWCGAARARAPSWVWCCHRRLRPAPWCLLAWLGWSCLPWPSTSPRRAAGGRVGAETNNHAGMAAPPTEESTLLCRALHPLPPRHANSLFAMLYTTSQGVRLAVRGLSRWRKREAGRRREDGCSLTAVVWVLAITPRAAGAAGFNLAQAWAPANGANRGTSGAREQETLVRALCAGCQRVPDRVPVTASASSS